MKKQSERLYNQKLSRKEKNMKQYDMEKKCMSDEIMKRIGYAFVPVQRIGKVYSPSKALMQGTVFPELDIGIDEYLRGLWNGK